MKVISLAAAGISLACIILTLVPSVAVFRSSFALAALVCSGITLATIVAGWRAPAPQSPAAAAVRTTPVVSDAPLAAPARDSTSLPPSARTMAPSAPERAVAGEAQVVGFLATLQEKGRLVDFLQDDIAAYTDAQVGAAARVVHQGCRAVLGEYFQIVPVREENEGAQVTVPAGYAADEYRLVGRISGSAPFSGTLMHRGWKTTAVHLPRVLLASDDLLPTIAPAEVELR